MDASRTRSWLHSATALESSVEVDIRAELQAHLELAADELMDEGASPELARERARERFGDLEQTVMACRWQKLGGRIVLQRLNLIATAALLVVVLFFGFRSYSLTHDIARLVEGIDERVVALEGKRAPGQERPTIPVENIYVELGDSLELRSTYHPEDLNVTESVDIDGTVLLPEIGHLRVVGLTRDEVEALLREKYAPYYELIDLHVKVHR